MSCTVRPYAPDDRSAVLALAHEAESTDGVAALNEESLFALERPGPATRVLVALGAHEDVIGVLVDAAGDGSGCDLVVAPVSRRRGVASTLIAEIEREHGEVRVWAHGDLPPAQAVAEALGARRVRELWRMSRPFSPDESFDAPLPDGYVARIFDGSDEQAQAWLDVNARAFANHPDQGRMTMEDFRERAAQPWFDPSGLILVWHEASGELAASHWTKREPGEDVGEVYVVAVAPEHQGRGLAGPLTALGLRHLRDAGARSVDLYVEGDNEPAKATYRRRGFERAAQDVTYLHTSPATM